MRTPHLDHLAKHGAVFDAAYSVHPVCVPARAALMTGRLASECDSFCNSTVWNGRWPTWGALLRNAGYRTFATGKLDLNDDDDLGFETLDVYNGHAHHPDITSLFRRPLICRLDERRMIDGTSCSGPSPSELRRRNQCIQLLDRATEGREPWAVYIGFMQPHPPFIGREELFASYLNGEIPMPVDDEEELESMHLVYQQMRHFKRLATPIPKDRIRRARAAYYSMITELDENVGAILDHLERIGARENTIIVYTSDHGESLGDHGLWMKGNLYDCSARVPLVISGPGVPEGARIRTPVNHLDLTTTLLSLAGAEGDTLGTALLPIDAKSAPDPRKPIFAEVHSEGNYTGSFMVRKGAWKYIHFTYFDEGLLFNLENDPDERRNRFYDPECAQVLDDLRAELLKQFDPESETERAFSFQRAKLEDFKGKLDRDGMVKLLESRLGTGQARLIAASLAQPVERLERPALR